MGAVMTDSLDTLFVLLIGTGMSDRKVRDLLVAVKEADTDYALKRLRAFRKAVQNVPPQKILKKRSIEEEVDSALSKLRSLGQYSEAEISDFLFSSNELNLSDTPRIPKGGLRAWLLDVAKRGGIEQMSNIVNAVRNDLAHNPRAGWTTKDLR